MDDPDLWVLGCISAQHWVILGCTWWPVLGLGTLQSPHIIARFLGQSTWTGEDTGPAWHSKLAPTAPVWIMPLTQYLCFLLR